LFWRRSTRPGVIAGMMTGISAWAVWVLLFHEKESAALGLCQIVFGVPSLVTGTIWATVDPIVLALPASALVTVVASLATRAESEVHPRSSAARAA
jgi:SSS family solute:Na+ symporter